MPAEATEATEATEAYARRNMLRSKGYIIDCAAVETAQESNEVRATRY